MLAQDPLLACVEVFIVEGERARPTRIEYLGGLREVRHEVPLPLLKPSTAVHPFGNEDQDVADDTRDRTGVGVELVDEVVGQRQEHVAKSQIHLRQYGLGPGPQGSRELLAHS